MTQPERKIGVNSAHRSAFFRRIETIFFYATIFITGAIILILEITGTRILAPLYGSTVYTWSSLITATMLSLALGYFFGGWFADRRPEIKYLYLFVLSAGILTAIIPYITAPVLSATRGMGLRWGPLVASFALFSPALFFLATVSPYAVKIKTESLKHLGVSAGNLYALSTAGSLFGGIFSGFYIGPNFSTNAVFLYAGGFLGLIFLAWMVVWTKQNKLMNKNKESGIRN